MEGEVHRKEPSADNIADNIIVRPKNWDDLVRKYEEREEENLQRVLERYNATKEELPNIVSKAIQTRANRASSEHKPLKDHTVQIEPKTPEILGLKQQLYAEITDISKRTLQPSGETPEHAGLKGRVSTTQKPNAPAA